MLGSWPKCGPILSPVGCWELGSLILRQYGWRGIQCQTGQCRSVAEMTRRMDLGFLRTRVHISSLDTATLHPATLHHAALDTAQTYWKTGTGAFGRLSTVDFSPVVAQRPKGYSIHLEAREFWGYLHVSEHDLYMTSRMTS